ncbi:hypothetical protein FK220_018990 [Flavobacteriaceae bacterium TP-CH-4]|uniref:Uncharacterized protein n=1 Tax=Pelagihabitans pacificus TaxID=2696054 RepID=A0A967AWZ0_9FLAO|nr:hypothetical protein [Pelagihabitans pacificus]NHF61447.1 hypothetical protein [Pelagihabitans pacificus]
MKTFKFLKTLGILAILPFALLSCDPDEEPIVEETSPTIDLAVETISFSVVKTSDFVGVATITGSIKNIADNFVSGTGQQKVYLYERSLGTPTDQPGNLVAERSFTNLAAGETLEVSFSRAWNASSPAEGEFPPEYILYIGYDPDIYIDGNEHNDDTNTSNDELLESGMAINDLFR